MAKSVSVMANLGLNTNKFNTGLKKSQRSLKSFGQQAKSTFGVGLGAAAIGAAGQKLINYSDKLDKTSKKLGITTDFLQKFRFAAEQTGVETRTTDMALQRFARRLGEAANGGGELLPVLQQYNIQTKDAAGNTRKTEHVMADLADTIKGIEDPQERLRVAFKAFDSEGAALVTTLADGSAGLKAYGEQAEKTGQIIQEDNIATLVEFKDQMNILSKAAMKLGTVLLSTFLNGGKVIGAVIGLIATRDLGAFKQVISTIGTSAEKLEEKTKETLGKVKSGVKEITKVTKEQTKEEDKQNKIAEKSKNRRAKELITLLKKAETQKLANLLAKDEIRILELLSLGREKEAAALQKKLDIERQTKEIMKEQGLSQEEAIAQATKRVELEEAAAAAQSMGGGGGSGGSGGGSSLPVFGSGPSDARQRAFAEASGINPEFAGQFIDVIKDKLASGQSIEDAARNARAQLNRDTDRASDTRRASQSLRDMFDSPGHDAAMGLDDRRQFLGELQDEVSGSLFKGGGGGGSGAAADSGLDNGAIPFMEDNLTKTAQQNEQEQLKTESENIALILAELRKLNEGLQ